MSKDRIDPARRRAIIDALKFDLQPILARYPEAEPMGLLFIDPREGGSLRLTRLGHDLLKDKFSHWSEQLPAMMTIAQHTYLVQVSTFPYYIDDGLLTTFDPNLGVLMKMVSGDFVKLERLLPRN